MPPRRCSLCKERSREKLATQYNAWFVADGSRICYRQTLCPSCFVETYKGLLQSSNSISTDNATCPACGGESETDSDPVYITLYLPKQEQQDFALDFDAACAAKTRGVMQEGAVLLADRQTQGRSSGAPEPSPWDELEL